MATIKKVCQLFRAATKRQVTRNAGDLRKWAVGYGRWVVFRLFFGSVATI